MDVDNNVQELAGALGFRLDIDGGQPLAKLTAAVDEVCERAEDSPTPAVVVLRLGAATPGERSWPGVVDTRQVRRWERAVRRIEWLAAVSITVASNTCAGPALDLLLATDYRIATSDLRLMLPVNDGQFWPGMALHRLAKQVSVTRARQLVLWGHELTAEKALDIGLIDEVSRDLEGAVQAAVLLLGRTAGADLAVRRQLLLEALGGSYEDNLGAHLAACDRELRRVQQC